MTEDATTSAPNRRDELLRQVEEQVAARREELSRLRRADGSPTPEREPEPAPAPGPPPPGTYAPDLPAPRRRLTLAPKPEAADPAPLPLAPAPADVGSADRLHDLAGAIATIARRLEELAAALEREARAAVDAAPAATAAPEAPADPASPQPQRRTGPLAEALSATPAPQQTAAAHLQARLVAIEMAVAGASRGDVAERLGREFFGEDAATILDDVFGSGSVSGARMPWAER